MITALIGFLGTVVGAAAVLAAAVLQESLQRQRQNLIDQPRKDLLLEMLSNPPPGQEWRRLETLSRVIGADFSETTRLLIAVGARGSETENGVWALKSKKPLGRL